MRLSATHQKSRAFRCTQNLLIGLGLFVPWLAHCHRLHAVAITWNVAGGGVWDTTTANWTGGSTLYTDGDDVTFNNSAGGVINITAPRAPLATNVTANAGTYTFSGSNLTSGGLNKQNGGTLVLNSAIASGGLNFTGGGTIQLGAPERLPDGSVIQGYGSGTLNMNNNFETLGGMNFGGNITNFAGMTFTSSGDRNGGSITGTGTLTFNLVSLHYFARTGGASTYDATVINTGNVRLYNGPDSFATTAPLTVNSPGSLVLDHYENNVQQTIGALSGNGNIATSTANTSGLAFRIGNGGGSGTYSGVFSGNGTLTKLGGGTQILSGNNTYTGTTTVSAGTLIVNGTTGPGQGNYLVSSGATLGGTGTINLTGGNSVTIANGGTLAPGNSPGTLTINGSLILNGTSNLDFELGNPLTPANSDSVVVNGNLTLDGVLNVTELTGFGDGLYPLFTYTGSLTNNGVVVAPGFGYTLNFDTPGVVALEVQIPVPEPSTLALVGLGIAGVVIRRRKARVTQ